MQCIDCIPSLFQADCSINSKLNNSKSQVKSRITPNSKLLIRTADAVRHANIVQRVKTCYKIKIDYRVFESRFLWFMLRF